MSDIIKGFQDFYGKGVYLYDEVIGIAEVCDGTKVIAHQAELKDATEIYITKDTFDNLKKHNPSL